ncbi:MAG: hypothetical protein ACRC3Y_12795 [Romboutsia sp.]|uniref:hypothetical protein n=1 Tax=Romboutsia sp. TaxID=1965302 RepID=UPI003F3ABEF6
MLNQLAKNQYVKMVKNNDEKNDNKKEVEYGIVLDGGQDQYEIMSIGFENKDGHFLEYPIEVENLVQTYNIHDAMFDEVKENEVRRKMNIWLEKNFKN